MFQAEYKLVVYKGLKVVHGEAPFYRLSDMVRSAHFENQSCIHDGFTANSHCKPNENWAQYHARNFPNSIVVKFLQKSDEEKAAIVPTLWSILKSTDSKINLPDSNTVVLHLRVGDVIDNTSIVHGREFWENKINTWQASGRNHTPAWANYTITKHDFESLTLPPDATKISIVYGFHTTGDHVKSIQYIQAVEEDLKTKFEVVTFETHENADDALRFMSHAKYFIPSGGGFSKLCAEMVKHNNGVVFVSALHPQ